MFGARAENPSRASHFANAARRFALDAKMFRCRAELGNRTLMMNSGEIVLDIKDEERKGLTVADLLEKFKEGVGAQLDNDRILLS